MTSVFPLSNLKPRPLLTDNGPNLVDIFKDQIYCLGHCVECIFEKFLKGCCYDALKKLQIPDLPLEEKSQLVAFFNLLDLFKILISRQQTNPILDPENSVDVFLLVKLSDDFEAISPDNFFPSWSNFKTTLKFIENEMLSGKRKLNLLDFSLLISEGIKDSMAAYSSTPEWESLFCDELVGNVEIQ
jgi:hypothetical protein